MFGVKVFVSFASTIIGAFGVGVLGAWVGHPICPNCIRSAYVLAAAPVRDNLIGGMKVESRKLYTHPPYSNVTPLNTSSDAKMPSRGTFAVGPNVDCFSSTTGTTGTTAPRQLPVLGLV